MLPDKIRGSEVVRLDRLVPYCATKVEDTVGVIGERLVVRFEIGVLFL